MSEFIGSSEVCKRLNVARGQLQKLFPYMLYLRVRKTKTHFFPSAYIKAYGSYLRQESERPTIATVRAFASTEEAKRFIWVARNDFKQALEAKPNFTAQEVMELLGIGRRTITDWYQNDVIKLVPQTRKCRNSPSPLLIPASELSQALEWKLPNS